MSRCRILVVTDPMCSWCWGLSHAVEEAAHVLREEVEFDLLLGGINLQATQPIGDYGRRHLLHIWREVQATTGQNFGSQVPDGLVYNSSSACVAVEAVRRRSGRPPFGFLHRLQQSLFVEARNISDRHTLDEVAQEFGWAPGALTAELEDDELLDSVRQQFHTSRDYGTNALPSVLLEVEGQRRLLFGGYADSPMMIDVIRQSLANA